MNEINTKGPLITCQTGWDESFLIGTKKELLDMANNIIEAVNNAKEDEFFGEKVKSSIANNFSFAQYSELSFDWVVVTKNSDQTFEIYKKSE